MHSQKLEVDSISLMSQRHNMEDHIFKSRSLIVPMSHQKLGKNHIDNSDDSESGHSRSSSQTLSDNHLKVKRQQSKIHMILNKSVGSHRKESGHSNLLNGDSN